MQEIAKDIFAIIGAVIILSGSIFACVFVFIWCLKSADRETDYLNEISEEEKLVITNYKIKTRVRFRDTLKRGNKREDK